MPTWDSLVFWYAKSLSENGPDEAELRIKTGENTSKLSYCVAIDWQKRMTDTSNALAEDKTSPDAGTARDAIEIKFTQERGTAPTTNALKILIQMFYTKTDDEVFRKARFGLDNTDNPELDVTPVATGGYKLHRFYQVPNPNDPALLTYVIEAEYVGDHNLLRAFA